MPAQPGVAVREQRDRKSLEGHSAEPIETRDALLHFGNPLFHSSEHSEGPAAIESPPRHPFCESVFFRQCDRFFGVRTRDLRLSQIKMGPRLNRERMTQAIRVSGFACVSQTLLGKFSGLSNPTQRRQ